MILEATQIGQTSKEAAADTFALLKPQLSSAEAGVAAGHTPAQLCKCHSPSSRHQALQNNRNRDLTSGIGQPRYTEEEKILFQKPEERQWVEGEGQAIQRFRNQRFAPVRQKELSTVKMLGWSFFSLYEFTF